MRAVAFFPKDKQTRVIDEPEPLLVSPTGVLIHMLEVGLCGTDREITEAEYGLPPPGQDHLVIGHESFGQVVEVGKNVRSVKPGDYVVLMVRRPCPYPECIACRAGRADFCYTGDFTERGIKAAPGFMADLVTEEEDYIVRVPQDLRDIGVLTEPLTIAEKAFEEVIQVQRRLPWGLPDEGGTGPTYRHKAVVLGAGPVGLLGAMVLAVRGFELYVLSREDPGGLQERVTQGIGGTYIQSTPQNLAHLGERVGNIDLIYEATGAAQISFDMLEHLGVNAVYVFTGVPGQKGPFRCNSAQIMRDMVLKNQVVLGTVNAPRSAFEAAITDLETFRRRWPDAVHSLITGKYPLDEAPDLLKTPKHDIKAVVEVGGQ